MRWIKASERLPEKEDNYFVKVQGIEYNNDNAEYTCGAFHHFVNTFEGKYFSSLPKHETVIEWLDETPDQPEPLPESFEKYMSEARDEFVLAIKNVERSNYLLTAVDSFLICFDQMRDRLAAASTVPDTGEDKLWEEAEDIYDSHSAPTGGGNEADYTDKAAFFNELRSKYTITKKAVV